MQSFDKLADEARDPKALTFARKSAIDKLARQADARVVGVLEELLGDREATIRREAINALGRARGARATRLLVRALDDGDRSCVKAALAQLGIRNDPAAAPALERLAETGDFAMRIEAKRLLTRLEAMAPKAEEPEQPRARAEPAPAESGEPPVQAPAARSAARRARKPPVPPPPPPEPPTARRGAEEQPAPEASLPPLRDLKRSHSRAHGGPGRRPWEGHEPQERRKTDPERVRARLIGLAIFFFFILILLIGTCVSR
jgi:hypothetical protein